MITVATVWQYQGDVRRGDYRLHYLVVDGNDTMHWIPRPEGQSEEEQE